MLRSHPGGAPLYHTIVHYEDRDSLRNWTEDDNRLWHGYVNYARHYLGREIAARVYNRADVPLAVVPSATASARPDRKDPLRFVSKTTQPELAWTLEPGDTEDAGGGANGISAATVRYDIEIYDRDRLVLYEESLSEARYVPAMELPCGEYRWSVRPSWDVTGSRRYGRWMRFPPAPRDPGDDESEGTPFNGLSGRAASGAPAYAQDFPRLTIACRR